MSVPDGFSNANFTHLVKKVRAISTVLCWLCAKVYPFAACSSSHPITCAGEDSTKFTFWRGTKGKGAGCRKKVEVVDLWEHRES